MQSIDLNLLVALDHLLRTESVTAAGEAMNLSASAMSRVLGRVREAFGDPILVRAGRRLVPTPRALALKSRLRTWLAEADAFVSTNATPTSKRTYVIRASDGASGLLAGALSKTHAVRFVPEGDEDAEPLRDGRIDLDVGVASATDAPELRMHVLARETFVGVVRKRHVLARTKRVTAQALVEHPHVSVSRRGRAHGPLDQALTREHLTRDVAVVVPSFYAAIIAVASTNLVAAVPASLARHVATQLPLHVFDLPVPTPKTVIRQAWHPRHDADPGHESLRAAVRAAWPAASRR